MTKTYLLVALALVACGSKDDKGKGGGDKAGGKGGGKSASSSEATIMLNKIASAAKEAKNTEGALPTGKVGPTPPEPCCKQADKKCKPDAAAWRDPVWQALGFAVEEPFAFQYSYQGDGKDFTAKAIGCDGATSMTVTGTIDPTGMPKIEIRE